MAYVKPIETDQLSLPSDPAYWVRIKRTATYGDQLAAQSAMLKLEQGAAGGIVSEMNWAAYVRALAASMIVEWNLTDEREQPLAVTAESLLQLTPEDGLFLATEVADRAKTREVERERPFVLPPLTP